VLIDKTVFVIMNVGKRYLHMGEMSDGVVIFVVKDNVPYS
jgi:hypothetical protein